MSQAVSQKQSTVKASVLDSKNMPFLYQKVLPILAPKALTKKRIGVRDPKREMRGGFFGVLLTVLSIWDTGHKQKNVKPPTIC